MMKRRGFRTFVAVLALVSMLLENTSMVFAVEGGFDTEQTEVYESTDTIETETSIETETADVSQNDSEETELSEEQETVPDEAETPEETAVEPVVEITTEENTEPQSSSEEAAITISSVEAVDGSRLEISGNEYIPLYIDTDQLNSKDTFRLSLDLPDGAAYDGLLNGELSKGNGNIYYLDNLQNRTARVSVREASEGVTVEYTVRGDGYPQISLTSAEEPEPEKELRVTEDGKAIEGNGLSELTITLDGSALNSRLSYSLYIGTDAAVTYEGTAVNGSITGLTKNTKTISLSDLDYQSFTIYAAGENTNTIAADYSIDSVNNSAVRIKLYDSGEEQKVKRDYTYEDELVYVTATLERADAVPDDAYFSVTRVEPESHEYDYDSYMDALNENSEDGTEYSGENTVLYDITFYTDETKTVEIEPEEGSVTVSIRFKENQLDTGLGAEAEGTLEINHLTETEDTIAVENIETETVVENGEVSFVTESFSIYSATYSKATTSYDLTYSDDSIEVTVKLPKEEAEKNSVLSNYLGDNLSGNGLKLRVFKRDGSWYNDTKAVVRELITSKKIFGNSITTDDVKYLNSDNWDSYIWVFPYELVLWGTVRDQWNSWEDYLCSLKDFEGVEVSFTFKNPTLQKLISDCQGADVSTIQVDLADSFYSANNQYNPGSYGISNVDQSNTKRVLDGASYSNNGDNLTFELNGASDIITVVLKKSVSDPVGYTSATANQKKVVFDSNGGSLVETQLVEEGKTASEPSAPTKDGCVFQGWYNGNTAYSFSTPVTSNITLKAKWDKNTVTFVSNGNSTATLVANGTAVQRPSDPIKSHHTFSGWYFGDTEYNFSTPVTEDIVLTAKFEYASQASVYTPGTSYTYREILGDAVYYGVTANTVSPNAHMDSNMAAGLVNGNSDTTQGVYTGNHNPGNSIAATVNGSWFTRAEGEKAFTIFVGEEYVDSLAQNLLCRVSDYRLTFNGETISIHLPDVKRRQESNGSFYYYINENDTKFDGEAGQALLARCWRYKEYSGSKHITLDSASHTSGELKAAVRGMVTGTKSESLAGEAQAYNFADIADYYAQDKDVPEGSGETAGKYTIDLRNSPAGTYYVNFAAGEYASKVGGSADGLHIRLNSNQNIVFNIPDTNVSLNQFSLDIGNGAGYRTSGKNNEGDDDYAKSVVWNLYNATTASNSGSINGIVLAPLAAYSIGTTSTGWVVADSVSNGGEWHCVWQEMPANPAEPEEPGVDTPATVEIPVSKSFAEGAAWPEGDSYTFTLTGQTTRTVETTSTGSCYTATARIHQTPETGREDYRIQVDAIHGGDHTTDLQTVKIAFNQPVQWVSCNAQGAALVSGSGTNQLTFTTTYHQNPTDRIGFGDLVVTSDGGLAVTDIEVTDGYGTTTVTGSETITAETEAGSVTIGAAAGTGSIGPLTFEPADTAGTVSYYYTLAENEPEYSDVIRDPKVYEIRVDVTTMISGKNRTATAKIYYKNTNGDYVELPAGQSFTFENRISAGHTPAQVTFNVAKSYQGDWTGKSFTFTISGSEGAPMPKKDGQTVTSVTTAADSSQGNSQTLSFGTIEFAAGDSDTSANKVPYTYTITETPGTDPDIAYDPTIYTITLNTYTVKEGNNWVAKVEKEGADSTESYTGETLSFENKIATGNLTVQKSVTGWWRITCERMGNEASVADPVFGPNHTHRKIYCGDPSHWRIDLDENGVPTKLTEIDTPYPTYNNGELPCVIYTDDTYTTVRDISTIRQGETIYWTSVHDGIKVQWRHYGTVESTGSFDFTVSKDDTYYYMENGVVKESSSPVSFSLEAGEKVDFTGLPVGEYTVTELGSENIFTVSVKDGEGSVLQTSANGTDTSATVNVTAGETSATVNFVNQLTAGTLRIKKNVNPGTVDYSGQNFYVRVTGPYDFDELLTLTIDEEGKASVALTDLPVGTYTVQETNADGIPLAQDTPYKIHMWGYGQGDNWSNNASINLTGGSDITVRISNTIGSLQVNKTLVPTNSTALSDTFYFAVTDGTNYYDTQGNAYTERHVEALSFENVTQETTQSLLFKNLPLDRKYSVREQMAVSENGATSYVDADSSNADFNYQVAYETVNWASSGYYTVQGADNIEAITGDKGNRPLVNVNITNTEKQYSEINIHKGGYHSNLGGVVFELTRNGKPVVAELVSTDPENNTYHFVSADGSAEATRLVTGSQGQVGIHELPWGEYYIKEVDTATGYVVSEDAWLYVNIKDYPSGHALSGDNEIKAGSAFTGFSATSFGKGSVSCGGNVINDKGQFELMVTKTGDGAPLAGAEFTLYKADGTTALETQTITARYDGTEENKVVAATAKFSTKLDWDETYILKETKVPEGYVKAADQTIALSADDYAALSNSTYSLTIDNKRIEGQVTLTKHDSAGTGLSGGEFEIHKGEAVIGVLQGEGGDGHYTYANGAEGAVTTIKTDTDGNAVVTGLPYGNYTFVETKTPDDSKYSKDAEQSFAIVDDGDQAAVVMVNTTNPAAVQFKKVDATTGRPIKDVPFYLYKADKTLYRATPYLSGADGIVRAENLATGSYYFEERFYDSEGKEIDPDNGYQKLSESDNHFAFTITESDGGSTVTLTENNVTTLENGIAVVKNEQGKGTVTVTKRKDTADGDLISGITFELYQTDASKSTEIKQSMKQYKGVTSDGVVTFTGLDWGWYFLREVQNDATRPYILTNNGISDVFYVGLDVEGGSANIEKTIINSIKKGSVHLTKVDEETKAALSGAVFTLYKDEVKAGNEIGGENGVSITNAAGITIDNLEYGNYLLKETSAPAGYQPLQNPIAFTIDGEAERDSSYDAVKEIPNPRKTGTVTLTKYSGSEKIQIANEEDRGEFTLYSADAASFGSRIKRLFSGTDYYEYGTYTLGADGTLTVSDLPWGSYYFAETKAPKGYVADENKEYPFTIGLIEDNGNKTESFEVSYDVTNTEKPGKIRLVKQDNAEDRDADLTGAEFKLFKITDTEAEDLLSADNATQYPNDSVTYTIGENNQLIVDNVEWGTYYFEEIKPATGYRLPSDRVNRLTQTIVIGADNAVDSIGRNDTANTIVFGNDKVEGTIRLQKVDENNENLAGATFYINVKTDRGERNVKLTGSNGVYSYDGLHDGLFDRNSKDIADTDGDGLLVVNNLPYGTYEVYEASAPDGYNLVETPKEFTISEDGQGTGEDAEPELFVNSPVQAKVSFYKIGDGEDGQKKGLAGAIFHLYKSEENEAGTTSWISIGTKTSESDGLVEFGGLAVGDYYVVEDKAPEGYTITMDGDEPKKYTFTVGNNDDGATKQISPAVAFGDGKIGVNNAQAKGTVKLFKSGSNAPLTGLNGAKYALYQEGTDTQIFAELETGYSYTKGETTGTAGEAGYLTVSGLDWGTYYFIETSAPEGYKADTKTKYTFKVDSSNTGTRVLYPGTGEEQTEGKIITTDTGGNDLKVVNEQILGQAKLTKKNSVTKAVIEGATFRLYYDTEDSQAAPQLVAGYENTSFVTDNKGEIKTSKDLPVGKYYFAETSPMTGYIASVTKYAFEVNESNYINVIPASDKTGTEEGVALNQPILGKVKLFKYETVDGEEVAITGKAKFRLYKESRILWFNSSQKLDIYETTDGYITVEDLEWGTYYFVEEEAPKGYVENKDARYIFTIDGDRTDYTTASTMLKVENERQKGSLKLKKTDEETGSALKGAEFNLYKGVYGSGTPVAGAQGLVTDSKGEITVTGLDWGQYYFVETQAPTGYTLKNDSYVDSYTTEEAGQTVSRKLIIDANNVEASAKAPLTAALTNGQIYGNVRLTKYDDKTPAGTLGGARFELYTTADARVYVSGENGAYQYSKDETSVVLETPSTSDNTNGILTITGLPYGNYYFKEIKAPEGYTATSVRSSFSIEENKDGFVDVTCMNGEIKGAVEFTKLSDDETPIEDAKFILYKKATKNNGLAPAVIGEYHSDSAGKVSAAGLTVGEYYFTEQSTPHDAWELSTEALSFEITDSDNGKVIYLGSGDDHRVVNTRKQGSVRLLKTYRDDDETGVLEGAGFRLYRMAGSEPASGDELVLINSQESAVTDEKGEINVTGLPWGDYYFVEISAPDGYVFDPVAAETTYYRFRVDETTAAAMQTVSVENERQTGSLTISKLDSTDHTKGLDGVAFNLYKIIKDSDGKEERTLKATLATSSGGQLSYSGLPWGDYVLVETGTINGYVLDTASAEHPFTIGKKNDRLVLEYTETITNRPVQGYVELAKVDSENNNIVLGGVAFDLYSGIAGSGTKVGEYMTDAAGKLFQTVKNGDGTEKTETKIGPLNKGNYYFLENADRSTLKGYQFSDQAISFAITEDGKTISFTGNTNSIKNTKKTGKVRIRKIDSETKDGLAGAEFTLYAREPKSLGERLASLLTDEFKRQTYTTKSDGVIEIEGLDWGKYFLAETKAAPGYELLADSDGKSVTYDFEITEANAGSTIVLNDITNTKLKGSVQLTKTDEETNAPVAGAKFKLYKMTGSEPVLSGTNADTAVSVDGDSEWTTNDKGVILVPGLDWGSYYFVETAPARGYEEFEENSVVSAVMTIDASNYNTGSKAMNTQTVALTNKKGYGYISLQKIFVNPDKNGSTGVYWSVACDVMDNAKWAGSDVGVWGADEIRNTEKNKNREGHQKIYCGTEENQLIYMDDNGVPTGMLHDKRGSTSERYAYGDINTKLYTDETYQTERDFSTLKSGEYIYWTTWNGGQKWYHHGTIEQTLHLTDEQVESLYYPPDDSGWDLSGVTYRLINDDTSKIVGEYVTNSDGVLTNGEGEPVIGPLAYGTYHFEEVALSDRAKAAGYQLSSQLASFVISKESTLEHAISNPLPYVNHVMDVKGGATFQKVDADNENTIVKGISFKVYQDGATDPTTTVVSDENGTVKVENLPMGTYYFEEDGDTARNAGYVPDTTKYYFRITQYDNGKTLSVHKDSVSGDLTGTVTNEKQKGSISLAKLGHDDKKLPLARTVSDGGAQFELWSSLSDTEPYYTADKLMSGGSDNKGTIENNGMTITVSGLPWATYYFRETAAPTGYVLPAAGNRDTNSVTIYAGNAYASVSEPLSCTKSDLALKVKLSKLDENNNELIGATLELYKADADGKRTGAAIDSWTSGGSPRTFTAAVGNEEGLAAGQGYVLHEAQAPAGYTLSDDIWFRVASDGTVTAKYVSTGTQAGMIGEGIGTTITMTDTPIELSISKKAWESGNMPPSSMENLSGAMLQIKEKASSRVVESWTSNGTNHKVAASLSVGTEYVLEETSAPTGYIKISPITFTIDGKGDIRAQAENGTDLSPDNNNHILYAVDRPIFIQIAKTRLTGSETDYVSGAKLAVYEVLSDGTLSAQPVVPEFTTKGVLETIDSSKLKVGSAYRLVELSAPDEYLKAEPVTFVVKDYDPTIQTTDGRQPQIIKMKDELLKVYVQKQGLGEQLAGASLQLLDSSGEVVAEWKTENRPAAIVSSTEVANEQELNLSDYQVVSTKEGKTLKAGVSYRLVELSDKTHPVPAGYNAANAVNFTLQNNTTVVKTVTMTDQPLAVAFGKKSTSGYLAGATMQLLTEKNKEDTAIAQWRTTDKPVIVTLGTIAEDSKYEKLELSKGVLELGKTYYLHEKTDGVPSGYYHADDIPVTIDNTDILSTYVREVDMVDVEQGKTSVPVSKTWIIPRDANGNPASDFTARTAVIELYRDSTTKGKSEDLVATYNMTWPETNYTFAQYQVNNEWRDLEKNSPAGYEYTYKVVEKETEAIKADFNIIYDSTPGVIINRTLPKVTDLTVTKTWQWYKDSDTAPQDVTVYLLQNGTRMASHTFAFDKKDITVGNTFVSQPFTFESLPKYNTDTGLEYVYTVEEEGTGFTSQISYDRTERTASILNVPDETPFYISGKKTWIDPTDKEVTHPQIVLALYRDGEPYLYTELDEKDEFTFGPLYQYNLGHGGGADNLETADGHPYTYEVKEIGAAGYDVTITYGENSGNYDPAQITGGNLAVNVENRIKNETINIAGVKYWRDRGDAGRRPDSVTFELFRDDVRLEDHTATIQTPNIEFRFDGLTKYKYEGGKAIPYVYTVKEQALDGYVTYPDAGIVVNNDYLTGLNTYSGVNFTNTPTAVNLSKVDQSVIVDAETERKAELTGAVMELYALSEGEGSSVKGEVLQRWVSGLTPHYVEGLPYGWYRLVEADSPEKYWDSEPIDFEITANDILTESKDVQLVTMEDEPIIGEVSLQKMDENKTDRLGGAEFELFTEAGAPVNVKEAVSANGVSNSGQYEYSAQSTAVTTTTLKTTALGDLNVTGLPYGTYYFKESKAPKGYELNNNNEVFSVSIATASRAAVDKESKDYKKSSVTVYDKKKTGAVRLLKSDEEGKELAGATFELYSPVARTGVQAVLGSAYQDPWYRYGTYTTNELGEIYEDGLPWGQYYFIETEAPDGYLILPDIDEDLSARVFTFEVDANWVEETAAPIVNDEAPIVNIKDRTGGGTTPTPGPGGEGGTTPTPGPGGEGGTTPTPGPGGEGGTTPTPGPGGEGGTTPTPGPGGEGGTTPTPGPGGEGGTTPTPGPGGEGGTTPTPGPGGEGGITPTPAPTSEPGGGITPTPTIVPTTVITVTPTPTILPVITTTPAPTRARVTEGPTPTVTPEPTEEPTPVPGVTDEPIPTEVVVVVVTETPTYTPTPTATPTAAATPTVAPTLRPTVTPTATVTPIPTAAVLGARRTQPGGVVAGVLGVRSAPTQGVLGARVGPVTGDAANIALWLIILSASIGAVILILVQSSKKKKAGK
ncbi:MAG: InlB B-repeat-containing protein [Lachnospiraceae bacterium]|nr:InlB B-repeat-containing protein [Lachnospiraceae bacterium]